MVKVELDEDAEVKANPDKEAYAEADLDTEGLQRLVAICDPLTNSPTDETGRLHMHHLCIYKRSNNYYSKYFLNT